MTTETLIENQISLLGPEYRSFVESSFIEEMARAFGAELGFNQRQVDILENAVFLFLTLIFTAEETKDFIIRNCDLPPSETELMWSAIESSLPEGMMSLINQARVSLEGTVTSPTNPTEAQPAASLETEIAQVEHQFASMEGIRTMATDMKSHAPVANPTGEVIYRSSQSDILPTQNSDTPRWESE